MKLINIVMDTPKKCDSVKLLGEVNELIKTVAKELNSITYLEKIASKGKIISVEQFKSLEKEYEYVLNKLVEKEINGHSWFMKSYNSILVKFMGCRRS